MALTQVHGMELSFLDTHLAETWLVMPLGQDQGPML
jgi:hypothetical protein